MSPQTNDTNTVPSIVTTPQEQVLLTDYPSRDDQPPRKRRWGRWLVLIGVVLIMAVGYANAQNIEDRWKLHNYHAPSSVSQLAAQDTMTAYGRKLLYLNEPDIADKTAFSTQCLNKDQEQSIVLGCYHSVENGIYLLKVTDPRLNGVEQVTAAHEMLHAAYDRLSPSERKKVDAMLEDYYQHHLSDPRVINEIALYKKTEPNDVVNEMHSVFGTEVGSLPPQLEQYYKKYFTNRTVIVNYANQYQATFTALQNQVKDDDTQLASMKTAIDKLQASLNSQVTVINQQQQNLKQLRVTDQAGYNAAVPGYNKLVDAYNSDVKALDALVRGYNALVDRRNAIALQEQQLSNDLNANATPITSN